MMIIFVIDQSTDYLTRRLVTIITILNHLFNIKYIQRTPIE